MKTATSHNFHIPLPTGVYSQSQYWLEEQDKLALHEQIASYAEEMAGTCDDLDEQLEVAGLEHLNNSEKQP